MFARPPHDYSATMDLRLRVHGRILDVGQVGHRFLILAETCDCPPGTEAELVVTVDGKETVQILPDGTAARNGIVHFQ